MDNVINQLYNTLYSDFISPEDLIKNIKTQDYQSLEYRKDNGFIVVTTKCTMKEAESLEFVYYFSSDDVLQKIDMNVNGEIVRYYDKKSEFDQLCLEVINTSKMSEIAV